MRIETKPKKCVICDKSFNRKYKESLKQYEEKICCSRECGRKSMAKSKKGKPSWNVGISPSKETREKLRKANLGKKLSEETKERMSISSKKGEQNHKWKGKNVGYWGLHLWIGRKLGKPTKCEFCGKDDLKGKQIHWANKSGKYKRKLSDWIRLCTKCHKKYDSTTF